MERMLSYIVAHAIAVAAASVAFTCTVFVVTGGVDPACTVGCDPTTLTFMAKGVGAALLITFLGVVASFPLLMPITLLCLPLAVKAVCRIRNPWVVAACGAAAGLIFGLPLTMIMLGLTSDQDWTIASLSEAYVGSLRNLGPAAAAAGAGFAATLRSFEAASTRRKTNDADVPSTGIPI